MVEEFLTYLEVERRYSDHTVLAYKSDINSFLDFHQLPESKIERNHIRAWMIQLSESGYENKSINRKLSTLKSYYKFLMLKGYCSSNPTVGVVSPKVKKRLPEFVPEKDMSSFEGLYFDENVHLRTKTIIELFYQTGLRLSELINLKKKNVGEGEIKVLGKRNKERIIPVSKSLHHNLVEWIHFSEQNIVSNHTEYVFVTDKGNKLYPKYVYRLVNKFLGTKSTISKKSPHILRHTFATHMLNNGAEIESVKEILGHSSLAATQVYTHNSIARLKTAYKKSHPRG